MTDAWDGRPQNPERDGWHWVAWAGNEPEPTLWTPHGPEKRGECWHWDGEWMGPGWVCANAEYHGPCLTSAEVAAAVAAEREVCARLVGSLGCELPRRLWEDDECVKAWAGAFAEALRQARNAALEEAARHLENAGPLSYDIPAAAIRALMEADDAG